MTPGFRARQPMEKIGWLSLGDVARHVVDRGHRGYTGPTRGPVLVQEVLYPGPDRDRPWGAGRLSLARCRRRPEAAGRCADQDDQDGNRAYRVFDRRAR